MSDCMNGGLVGIIANDSARYSLFTRCSLDLILPEGWKREMLIGGDWCGARNDLCRAVLAEGYSHLWFMDDDHAFAPDMLERLLAHDKALVSPLCLTRVYPFTPVQYASNNGTAYLPIPLSEAPEDGLVEIVAGGCAGMLIRRDVIEAIEPPWFEYADRSEDIIFCEKAVAAGFDLWCDVGCLLGHITTAVVTPARTDQGWATGLRVGGDLDLIVNTAEQEAGIQNYQGDLWFWELRHVLTENVIAKFTWPANTAIRWNVPDPPPTGLLQWYVDEGQGFHALGDPYTYDQPSTTEEEK